MINTSAILTIKIYSEFFNRDTNLSRKDKYMLQARGILSPESAYLPNGMGDETGLWVVGYKQKKYPEKSFIG